MNFQSRRLRTVVCIGLFAGAFVMSHTPPPPPPSRPLINDKLLHFCGFALLGMAVIWRGLSAGRPYRLRAAAGWLLLLAAYGAMDELTQPITGRTAELGDWVADVCGGATGIAIMLWLHGRSLARSA
jgi:VanZ family protein